MKKSKKARLKLKAWNLFSEYIRRRDADKSGLVNCVTCGKLANWKGDGMQAGHFIPGRTLSILFDYRNCHNQCYSCNVGRSGNQVEYFVYMEKRYGREVIDELRRLKYQARKYGIGDYELLISDLERKIRYLDDQG